MQALSALLRFSALIALVAAGCTELGSVGAPCDSSRPCNTGLECLAGACEELNNVIVDDAGDPPVVDAGKKIPPSDAGSFADAGPLDAGSSADAGTDAGVVDAGPQSVCGDGLLEVAEACDDENNLDGDGCNASCEVEADFECYGLLKSYCARAAEVVHVVACADLLDNGGDRLYLIETHSWNACRSASTAKRRPPSGRHRRRPSYACRPRSLPMGCTSRAVESSP